MSGDWRGTLWTLLVTFCIVIIRCTETFWSPCILYYYNIMGPPSYMRSVFNRKVVMRYTRTCKHNKDRDTEKLVCDIRRKQRIFPSCTGPSKVLGPTHFLSEPQELKRPRQAAHHSHQESTWKYPSTSTCTCRANCFKLSTWISLQFFLVYF
jgi:hypothetical protein